MKALIFMLAMMTASAEAGRLYQAQSEKRDALNRERCAKQLASSPTLFSDPDYIGPCDAISLESFNELVKQQKVLDAISADPKARPVWPKRW